MRALPIEQRVSRTDPLADAARALVARGTRTTAGKLVVTIP